MRIDASIAIKVSICVCRKCMRVYVEGIDREEIERVVLLSVVARVTRNSSRIGSRKIVYSSSLLPVCVCV